MPSLLDYPRTPGSRRPLPLTLFPSGGEGIKVAPSPSARERAGVRVVPSSRSLRASQRGGGLRIGGGRRLEDVLETAAGDQIRVRQREPGELGARGLPRRGAQSAPKAVNAEGDACSR